MRSFFMKMRGEGKSPPRVSLKEVLVSWVGAFLGIFAVGFLGHLVHLEQQDILFLIGSFGASAVLLYGTLGVPLAQPRFDGRLHPLGIDRSSDLRMDCRSALLVRNTLRGNCDRGHASDEDHTPARRSDSPDRRDR